MKQNLTLFFLFLYASATAQSHFFVPKKGKVIFKEETVVVNHQKLDSSLVSKKPLLLSMMRDFTFEMAKTTGEKIEAVKIDSAIEVSIKPALDFMLDPRKRITPAKLYSYVFEDSIIKEQILNSPLDKNKEITVINRSDGKLSFYTLEDSVLVKNNVVAGITIKESNKNLNITEYRDVRKNILSYDCFKIVVTKNGSPLTNLTLFDTDVSPEFKEKHKEVLEPISEIVFFVTEKIRCKYHPLTNLSEVLDKYYPLEIITKDGLIQGFEKRGILQEISVE